MALGHVYGFLFCCILCFYPYTTNSQSLWDIHFELLPPGTRMGGVWGGAP